MTAYNFPYVPDEASGEWVVTFPPNCAMGEVLVYAEPLVTPVVTGLRWPLDETSLPFLEESAYDHQLTSTTTGTISFGRDSLRDDGSGASITQLGSTDLVGSWSPPITVDDTWTYAIAFLWTYVSPFGSSAVQVRLEELIGISHSQTTGGNCRLQIWNGTTYTTVDTGLDAGAGAGAGGVARFVAVRITAAGAWTFWLNDETPVTGTATLDHPADTRLQLFMNDGERYFAQDIFLWQAATVTDADIEDVRDYLLGL